MKKVNARVHIGGTVYRTKEIELYTKEEARAILVDKDWEIGTCVFDVNQRNKRIGWLAQFGKADGIYVEAT